MGWASDVRRGNVPADDSLDRYEKALGYEGMAELRRRWSEWHAVERDLLSFYPALYKAALDIWCVAGYQHRNVKTQLQLSEYISEQAELLLEVAPVFIAEQWEAAVRSLYSINESADSTPVPYRSFSKYDFLELPILNRLLPLYDSVQTHFTLFWSDYIKEVDRIYLPESMLRYGSFASSGGHSLVPSRPIPCCHLPQTQPSRLNSIRSTRSAPPRKKSCSTITTALQPKPIRIA